MLRLASGINSFLIPNGGSYGCNSGLSVTQIRSVIYRGDVKANAIAKNMIPMADIAVNERRTAGRARKTDALSTAATKVMYQEVETEACTQAKINMPQPNEKCFGTNEGMNATAKTAAFTFIRFVTKPNRYAPAKDVFAPESKSNLPNSFRNCHKVCNDKKVRKATPAYLSTENAVCDLAKIADKPTADNAPQINSPVELPTME